VPLLAVPLPTRAARFCSASGFRGPLLLGVRLPRRVVPAPPGFPP